MLSFTLELQEIPFEFVDPKKNETTRYVLRELIGTLRDQYLNTVGARMKADGKGVRDFIGLQATLLVLGMKKQIFENDVLIREEPVTVPEVQALPARVVDALFQKLKAISGLDDEAGERAKNE